MLPVLTGDSDQCCKVLFPHTMDGICRIEYDSLGIADVSLAPDTFPVCHRTFGFKNSLFQLPNVLLLLLSHWGFRVPSSARQ